MRPLVIALLGLAGCLANPAVECGNRLCPPDTECVASLNYCARPDQLMSCSGMSDGAACPNGTCTSGVCVESVCGNGVVDGLEDCDGSDLGENDCFSAGGYYGGTLGCKSDCRFDLSGCLAGGKCGDGNIDVGHELCDGSSLSGKSCTDFGFYKTDGLACSGACTFDVQGCSERCGDGVINGPELCDGALPGASACFQIGHDAGQLGCSGACTVSSAHCADFAWTVDYTGQSGSIDYRWVWGIGDTFFAAAWGNPASVLRSDGGAWSVTPGPAGMRPIQAFWGASATDVFAVSAGVSSSLGIYHYDGATWTKMTTPAVSNTLYAVWGASANDVWAVGSSGMLAHYNGTWSTVTSPTSQTLYGIWGSSSTNIWAVGAAGTIVHYSSGTWTSTTVGTGTFYGIWGRSATEIYAVGSGTIYRYDGNSWQPQPSCTSGGILEISGIPGGGAFVVGGGSTGTDQCQLADGAWFKVTSRQALALESVAATSAGVVAGGSQTLVRGSGGNYLEIVQPSATIMGGPIGAYVRTANDIYVVGASLGNGQAIHWTGTTWNADTLPAGTKALADVAGATGTPVFAVGGDGSLDKGTILKNVSGTWTTDMSGTGSFLHGVAVVDATHAFAVGGSGTVWTWNGTTWSQVTPAPTFYDLQAVAALSSTNVWAVGGVGRIVHFNGTSWQEMVVGTQSLTSIWAASATDIWAVGDAGTILHYDGVVWRSVASGTTANLKSIVGSTNERIIVGVGVILEWVGGHWQQMGTPYRDDSVNTSRLAGHGDFILFLGGFVGSQGNRTYVGFGGSAFRYAASETACDDFWDDDLDGTIDCADTDCAADPACVAGGVCSGAVALACGAMVSGTTSGGPAKWSSYGCSGKGEPGAERYYRFTPSASGTATFALSGFTGDLDLVVAGTSSSGACIPDTSCLGAAQTAATSESVAVTVEAGKTYYVVVDGQAASAFSLSATCQ